MKNNIEVIEGDLLQQEVDVIVNPWNRNIIPWWLLIPQGVSGAIKRQGGYQPFREVAKFGSIPVGGAVLTSAGKLPFKGIIHVAGINLFWCSTNYSIEQSVKSAIAIVNEQGFNSVAFPLIGAGTGGKKQEVVKAIILGAFNQVETQAKLILVIYAGH